MGQPTKYMIFGGTYFDPYAPRAEDLTLAAFTRGLEVSRFNNQTTRPVTVGGHMVRCAMIWCALWKHGVSLSREHHVLTSYEWLSILLALLVHDAAEALIGDRLRPIKTDQDRELEQGVLAACIDFLLCPKTLGHGHAPRPHDRHTEILVLALRDQHVRDIDWISCRVEALLWQPGAYDWAAPAEAEREAFCVAFSVSDRWEDWRAMLDRVVCAWVEAGARPERASELVRELAARFG